jgi:hypothetical protein
MYLGDYETPVAFEHLLGPLVLGGLAFNWTTGKRDERLANCAAFMS